MGISEQRGRPANTQEFLVMWSAAKEEHLVEKVAPLLPLLLGSAGRVDETQTKAAARHLVRALQLAATPEAGLAAALDYLTAACEGEAPDSAT